MPLYIFAGPHLLCARQRRSNQNAAAGSVKEVERIVAGLRAQWPGVRLIVRADSGFCREELLSWCERNNVKYVIGLARNKRLRALIDKEMQTASERQAETGKAAREIAELRHQTLNSWSRERRVMAKAEQLEGKENPRYVVTSLSRQAYSAQKLYEQLYCARGEMENRIKEQLSLFSGSHERANDAGQSPVAPRPYLVRRRVPTAPAPPRNNWTDKLIANAEAASQRGLRTRRRRGRHVSPDIVLTGSGAVVRFNLDASRTASPAPRLLPLWIRTASRVCVRDETETHSRSTATLEL